MSETGSQGDRIAQWRQAYREVEAALRILAEFEPNQGDATAHVRTAWGLIVLAAGKRHNEDTEPADEDDGATRKFAERWLRQHYGDDAHVEGGCLSWIFSDHGSPVAPLLPAELRSHALWMRTRIQDHLARREGLGSIGVCVLGIGLLAMLTAVLVGELGAPDAPWQGEYFPKEDFTGKSKIEFSDEVEFNFGRAPPMAGIPKDEFSVRWTTCLVVDETADFAFDLMSDDGSRLFVDGVQVIDNWGTHGKRSRQGSIELEDGTHLLEVEYFDRRYEGKVKLTYDPDGGKKYGAIAIDVLQQPKPGENPCD
ncbi:MAG: hypothetical protein JKY37_22135 [Nannocystaceae bacterium]|nr:hypothetical protein [Nannocystaceae bacterium]